jgi:hypothetical protein
VAQRAFIHRTDVETVDGDTALRRLFQPVDQANERRLAGAALADDADDGAFGDVQIDIIDRLYFGGLAARGEDLLTPSKEMMARPRSPEPCGSRIGTGAPVGLDKGAFIE